MSVTTTVEQTPASMLRRPVSADVSPNTSDDERREATLATFKDHQDHVLPHRKLMVVFPAIALAQMISYLDQTSVSTALPAIGDGLNMGPSISWVATSFLVASTSVQLINGRLSDIVGRKPLLITCMGILAIGNLGAGFSTTPAMLFAFRALSGLGGGMITALVMIVCSDITTLEQRGKYNGFIGAMVALGNGLGPIIGGAVTQRASWRWVFWFIVPLIVAIMGLLYIAVPPSQVRGKTSDKIKMIDWTGLLINIAAVLLLLIPISEGGALYAWDSSLVIGMLIVGGLLAIAFVIHEWKFAKLPMMPIRLFQSDYSANLIFIQATLHGLVYWANLFYVPLYLQNVRGYDPVVSASLVALLAHSRKADRAVVNSLRNFLRTIGGSVGLTICGTILNNILKSHLSPYIAASDIKRLTSSVYALSSLNLTPEQYDRVLDAYMSGMHAIFVLYAPIIGICCIAAVLIKDNGVAEKDAKKDEQRPVENIALRNQE
ncbi:hypothetical protein B7494_g1209 [Chlorociboria aeruginascens]|nr:hypothetical protein B7494_g1209 [Chlorociboria aeruginascens]